jgi:hypothetical protein
MLTGAWEEGHTPHPCSQGPVEPGPERLDVGGVDGRAAPDAQARRGVAVAGDVEGGAFLLEQLHGHLLDPGFVGAVDGQADAGLRADRRVGGEVAEPVARFDDAVERGGIGVAARDQRRRARRCFDPFQREIASSTASIEGVLIVSPEDALDQLALGGQAEDLGQRPGGRVAFQPLDRAGPRISTPCAPSPPSTFCQEKVATSILSHGRS